MAQGSAKKQSLDHGELKGNSDDDHSHYLNIERFADAIDFDTDADAANLSLSTTFANSTTHTYTPPAGWSTYKLMAVGQATVAGVTAADDVQSLVVASGNGNITGDNAQSTSRTVVAARDVSGLSGNTDVSFRIRNATANRGAVYTTWLQIIAIRET